ncbi:hypothetical protein C8Q79DRAFT_1005202 [Trametes meyenii]|nr:hypothetical protein C8Q79DRAFT_1005202 [Trametes meyenii]
MWTHYWALLSTLVLLWPLQGYAANFTFSYGVANQCDDFQVSWTGGTAPFQLTFAPAYGTPRTLNIPANNFNNGKGSFTTTLPFATGKQVLAIMSDATGFASGGISKPITVGKTTSKQSCNTTDIAVDFFYETNLALNQCRTYSFTGYGQAVQPITIRGLIPGGTSFVLNPPRGSVEFEWVADIAQGTSLMFIVTDAQGRQGGSSQINVVGMSDDNTCLVKGAPASVTNAPSRTSPPVSRTATSAAHSTSATASSTGVPDTTTPSGKTSAGTVVAAVIACLVAAFIVGTLVWWFLRRRRGTSVFKGGFFGKFHKKEVDLMHDPGLPPPASVSPYPLYHPQAGADISTPNSTINLLGEGRPSSFYASSTAMFAQAPPSAATAQFPPAVYRSSVHEASVHGRPDEGSVASWDPTVTSGMRRKAAMAGVSPYAPSTRFILHTDIDDDPPPPPDDEVIELPPQYSERRTPAQPSTEPSSPGASGSGSRRAQGTDLPPPPSPTFVSSSPGLAYLSNRDSYASERSSRRSSRPS